MKYLTKEELKNLSEEELDSYAMSMISYKMKIVAVIELWVGAYNITSNEYDRRKPFSSKTLISSDSTTKH